MPPTSFATYGTRPGSARSERAPLRYQALRDRLDCRFDAVDDVFDECVDEARRKLSARGLDEYLDHARTLGKLGRGVEPLLVFLEIWPTVAGLAATGLLQRHFDPAPGRLQQCNRGEADRGTHGIHEAGDEQSNAWSARGFPVRILDHTVPPPAV